MNNEKDIFKIKFNTDENSVKDFIKVILDSAKKITDVFSLSIKKQKELLRQQKEKDLANIKSNHNEKINLLKQEKQIAKQNEDEIYKKKLSHLQTEKDNILNFEKISHKEKLSNIEKQKFQRLNAENNLHSIYINNLNKQKQEELNKNNIIYNELISTNKKLQEIALNDINERKSKELELLDKTYNKKINEYYNNKENKLNKIHSNTVEKLNNTYKIEKDNENILHLENIKQINKAFQQEKSNIVNKHNIEKNLIQQNYNLKVKDENKNKDLSINNIKQIYNEAKNKLGSIFNFNMFSNTIGEFTRKYRQAMYQISNIDEFEKVLIRVNDKIISETKRNLQEAFSFFKESDVYIRQIQSMRGISGRASDVAQGKTMAGLNYDVINESTMNIANKYGKSIQEINKELLFAVESGLEYEKAIEVLDTAVMGSIASHTNLHSVLKGLLKTTYLYGNETKGYIDIISKMPKVMNMFMIGAARGSLNVADFSENLGNVATQATKIGVPIEEAIATFSSMAQKMKSPSEAGTALINVFTKLSKTIQRGDTAITNVNNKLKQLGKNNMLLTLGKEGVIKEGGVINLLKKIRDISKELSTKESETFLNAIFNEIRASKGFQALYNSLDSLDDEVKVLLNDVNHLNTAFDQMTKSTEYKLESISNRVKNSLSTIYYNNRQVIDSAITGIADYIQMWLSSVITFAKDLLNPNTHVSKQMTLFLSNMQNLFTEVWKSINIVLTSVNNLFGTNGALGQSEGLRNTFIAFLMNLSHWLLLGAKAFNNVLLSLSKLSVILTPFVNMLGSFIKALANVNNGLLTTGIALAGILSVLPTLIPLIFKFFSFAMLHPVITTMTIALSSLLLVFSRISDTVSEMADNFEQSMNRIRLSAEKQENVQKLYEQYNKQIIDLEKQKAKLGKDYESTLNKQAEIDKKIVDLKKQQNRLTKEAEKQNIPLKKLKEVDVDMATKVTKEIQKSMNLPKETIKEGGILSGFKVLNKDKAQSNKVKFETKNRLDEIEDIYKQHLSNINEQFTEGEITKEEALRGTKVADTFKQIALTVLSSGKEINGGYKKYLETVNKFITDTTQITPDLIRKKSEGLLKNGINLNKKELQILQKQLSEIFKRIQLSETHYTKKLADYTFTEQIKTREEFSRNEIKRQEQSQNKLNAKILSNLNNEHNLTNEYINSEIKNRENHIEYLNNKELGLNNKLFNRKKEDVIKEKETILEEKRKLNDELYNLELGLYEKQKEIEIKKLEYQRLEAIINEEIYRQKLIELDEKYLINKQKLAIKYLDDSSPEANKQRVNEILNQQKDINDRKIKLEIDLKRQLELFNKQSMFRLIQNENVGLKEKEELFNKSLEINRDNIEELISDIESYGNSIESFFNKIFDRVTNLIFQVRDLFLDTFDIVNNKYINIINKLNNPFAETINKNFSNLNKDLQNELKQVNEQVNEILKTSKDSKEFLSGLISQSSQFANSLINTNQQINLLGEQKLDLLNKKSELLKKQIGKSKKEIDEINQEIKITVNDIKKLDSLTTELGTEMASKQNDALISLAIIWVTESVSRVRVEIDKLNKYSKNSFLDIITFISNAITDTFALPFEMIANFFGTTLKKQYVGQIEEANKIITENFMELGKKQLEAIKELVEKEKNLNKEISDLKFDNYQKEMKLIDELFGEEIRQSKERIKNINKEKQEEIRAIKEVNQLRQQRYIDQKRKQEAIKELNKRVSTTQFNEGFYRQTIDEFETLMSEEENKIKNKYETLGEIDFEHYQLMMRDLSLKKVSYYRRRLQGSDEPELEKILKEEEQLKRNKKALENAKLIAKLNKDVIKENELERQISIISGQLVNLQQLKEGNTLLKYRVEINKKLADSTKAWLDNFYDTEMEIAQLQDDKHRENVKALNTQLKIETDNLEKTQKLEKELQNEVFKDYNSGGEEWFKNMETRVNSIIGKAQAHYNNIAKQAGEALNNINFSLNTSNIKFLEKNSEALRKLEEYFLSVSNKTNDVQTNIEKIIADLNAGINIINNKELVKGFSNPTQQKAIGLQSQRQGINTELKDLKTNNSQFIDTYLKETKKDFSAKERSRLGINDSEAKLIDDLVNNYGIIKQNQLQLIQAMIGGGISLKHAITYIKNDNVGNQATFGVQFFKLNREVAEAFAKSGFKFYNQQVGGFGLPTEKEIKMIEDIINISKAFSNIKPFANGGVITKPTLALMGEAGNETVLNARQMRNLYNQINSNNLGSGKSTNVFNLSINNPVIRNDNDINKLVDMVSKKITREFTKQI